MIRRCSILLFTLLFTLVKSNTFYLDCDNITQQQNYFEQERIAFGIDNNELPFDFTNVRVSNVSYYPMSCRENTTFIRNVGIDTEYNNIYQLY